MTLNTPAVMVTVQESTKEVEFKVRRNSKFALSPNITTPGLRIPTAPGVRVGVALKVKVVVGLFVKLGVAVRVAL